MRKLLLALLLAVDPGLSVATPISVDQALSLPIAEVEAALPSSHPAVLYAHARRLFETGRRDEAVVWFYAGQLRFRFHLRANPSLPKDGEPALMASLNATVGQTINEWAGGSPRQWASAIDQALAWDQAHPNATTARDQHAAAWEATRRGLAGLRDQILTNQDQIREQRRSRGLENR